MIELSTVLWTACATASGMLGIIHALMWIHDRSRRSLIFSSIACFAACAMAAGEYGMMRVTSLEAANQMASWLNLAAGSLVVSLTWFVYRWFETGRKWLALAITLLWGLGLLGNFLLPGNLTFSEITSLESHQTFWGDSYVVPIGELNPLKWLPDLASILFLVFVLDASIKSIRQGRKRSALAIGGSIVFFILLAGIHSPLADAGIVKTPSLVGFSFLAIVLGLSAEMVREVSRASRTAKELRRVRSDLDHLGRVNLMGELSAAIAHEMSQPLTAIMANAQAGSRFLKNDVPDLDEVAEILLDIAGEGKRAREVIQRLRSMLEKGEVVREPTDLNEAAEEAVRLMETELRRNHVVINQDLSPEVPEILADRLGIQQVIVNLLLNAERASAAGEQPRRQVWLRSRRKGDLVVIEVADNGKGIADSVLPRLFEPFFSKENSGLGMGLSICEKVIGHHGGDISARNRPEGGAEFAFWLPVEENA